MISGSEVDNCSSDIEPVRKKPRIDTFIERSSEIVQEPNSNRVSFIFLEYFIIFFIRKIPKFVS